MRVEVLSKTNIGLAWNFHVSPKSCDNPEHYERFLRLSAISEYQSGRGITRVMIDDDGDESRIVGFMTLRATSLIDYTGDNLYVAPSIEIAELAIDEQYERQGYGRKLVDTSILIASLVNKMFIGAKYLMLCSDPCSVDFYIKCGFGLLQDYYNVLHDGWNDNCTPMFMRIPEYDSIT